MIRRLLARIFSALPAPVAPALSWSDPEPEPEPVTDPLNPAWRPDGEYVAPLFHERAMPPQPTWTWQSFTQAWPVINESPK